MNNSLYIGLSSVLRGGQTHRYPCSDVKESELEEELDEDFTNLIHHPKDVFFLNSVANHPETPRINQDICTLQG